MCINVSVAKFNRLICAMWVDYNRMLSCHNSINFQYHFNTHDWRDEKDDKQL